MIASNGYHNIIEIKYGIDDYIILQSGRDHKLHKLKIYYKKNGDPYFNYKGVKYSFEEFFRVDQ